MTASPAQPMPGLQPHPGLDEAPPMDGGPSTGATEEEPPERRRRRILLLLLLLAALLLLLLLAIWYLMFRQPVPLPTVPGQVVMPGYVTSVYGVQRPMGVAASSSGDRLWVGETEGDRVARVFDAGGTEVGQMLPPISSGPSHVPVYLAVDPITLEVYVTDRLTGAIFIYDGAGTYQRQFTPPAELTGWQPLGLTFDAAGNLYVSDVGSNPQRVVELDRSGAVVRSIGADAGLSFPNGIAVDGAGYTYVTDGNNGRLLVFDQTGAIVARVGRGVGEGDLGLPRGIAIDGKQRVYVADSSGQAVFVYGVYQPGTDRLEYLGSFGQQGIGNGQFEFPNGLALDGRGRVYVTDSANDRVQVWSY